MVMLKLLSAPFAIPIALSLAITLAGPGGPFEMKNDHEPAAQATRDSVNGSPDPMDATEETSATANGALGPTTSDVVATSLGESEAPFVADTANDAADPQGCVEALTDQAQSRPELEEHVSDPAKPEGGASGNQNALDHQCGGAFATETADEPTPEASEAPVAPAEHGPPPDAGNGNGNAGGQGGPSENGAGGNGH